MLHLPTPPDQPIFTSRCAPLVTALALTFATHWTEAGEPHSSRVMRSNRAHDGRACRCDSLFRAPLTVGSRQVFAVDSSAAFAPRELYLPPGMAYYDRPYAPQNLHISTEGRAEFPAGMMSSQYGTEVFRRAAERVESGLSVDAAQRVPGDTPTSSNTSDGFLEYYDWRRHRDARIRWEMTQFGETVPAPAAGELGRMP